MEELYLKQGGIATNRINTILGSQARWLKSGEEVLDPSFLNGSGMGI
jgi:hypothetical protein